MTVAMEKQQSFLEQLVVEEDSLARWRHQARERLEEIGLPTRKTEAYRYIRLRKLWAKEWQKASVGAVDRSQFAKAMRPECQDSCVVLVNGRYAPELSQLDAVPELTLLPLEEAVKKFRGFLHGRLKASIREESDPFALANHALHEQGAFLYLPPGKVVESPVQILHVVTGEDAERLFPRLQIFIGANSQLSILRTTCQVSQGDSLICGLLDVALEENANLKIVEVEGERSGFVLDAMRATLKRDARLNSVAVTCGATLQRRDYKSTLEGEGAEVDLSGLWLLQGDKDAHSHVVVDHQAPNCRSFQLFKGVNDDFTRSSFEGKILVRQAAQKTDAYQMNRNLILSENAHADSKPNLEIFADDVKASHGCTVGRLDPEQLHYLRTRGCPKQVAERLMIKGFAREVLEKIEITSLREESEADVLANVGEGRND